MSLLSNSGNYRPPGLCQPGKRALSSSSQLWSGESNWSSSDDSAPHPECTYSPDLNAPKESF